MQLLLGCFCLKSVTAYLPKALIDAYLSAAALLVVVSQFTFIFDVMLDFHKGSRDIFSIITASIIANCIHLHAESSSAVVSMIPQRTSPVGWFLPPTMPDLSNLSKIILHAFSLATVSCFLLVFIGERYASLHNYSVSSSQIAALMGAMIMLVIALTLGRFFQVIPNSTVAAIVVFNMLPFLEKILDIPTLWRKDKYHLAIWLGTFAAVLCLGLDIGLVIALALAFFIVSIRSHSMVQFVDLQGSDLLRQIFHMFSNIGVTVLIAGCHSSVISAFEKNEFFDNCVTKKKFFLTLHDALLAALAKHQKPDEIELTAKEHVENVQAEDEMVEYLAYS
ncbi:UNVERIFIED_CONTAM: hypothetical protein H355_016983 [Colinus virginianus]|nr:hypothetical protein H355_016983 [Colinus virginianus]